RPRHGRPVLRRRRAAGRVRRGGAGAGHRHGRRRRQRGPGVPRRRARRLLFGAAGRAGAEPRPPRGPAPPRPDGRAGPPPRAPPRRPRQAPRRGRPRPGRAPAGGGPGRPGLRPRPRWPGRIPAGAVPPDPRARPGRPLQADEEVDPDAFVGQDYEVLAEEVTGGGSRVVDVLPARPGPPASAGRVAASLTPGTPPPA